MIRDGSMIFKPDQNIPPNIKLTISYDGKKYYSQQISGNWVLGSRYEKCKINLGKE